MQNHFYNNSHYGDQHEPLTVHWQYGGVTNIFSAFVRYSTSVPADE